MKTNSLFILMALMITPLAGQEVIVTSKLLTLGPGTHIISKPILVEVSGTTISGHGARLQMMGEGPAIILKTTNGTPIRYCKIEGLDVFRGGILIENGTDCSIRDTYIHNVAGDGLTMNQCWANRLDNVKSTANTGHGLKLFKTTATVLTGGRYSANQGDGIRVSGWTTVIKMSGVTMEGNAGWGYYFDRGPSNKGASHNISFDTVYMEGNKTGGISIDTSENWSISVTDSRVDTPVIINSFDGRYENNHELAHKVAPGVATSEVKLTGKGWTKAIREGHYLRAPAFSHMKQSTFDSATVTGK